MKKTFSIAIRMVVSFGLLGGLFWVMREEIGDIWQTIVSSNTAYMMAAAVFLFSMVVMLSIRLKIVFQGEDLSLTFKESFELTCVGFFFNNFMPTAVGGDIVKAHYASNFSGKKVKSYASVLMDRIMGTLAILVIAGVAIVVDGGRFDSNVVRPMVIGLLVLGALAVVVICNRAIAISTERTLKRFKLLGIGERLSEIYAIVHDYRNRPEVVTRSIFFSVAAQASYCVMVFFLFLGMRTPVSLGNIFLLTPIVIFVSMLPSIGGLGIREYAMVTLFSVLVGREVAFAVSLLALAGNLLISVVGGIIYFTWSFKKAPVDRVSLADMPEIQKQEVV